ncbi:mucin-2-like [Oscarella lobularis]|uniref:mucin-2-like n=1 Tax=Oscarella lobularis TaxID=121494 RepID=UPI003313C007
MLLHERFLLLISVAALAEGVTFEQCGYNISDFPFLRDGSGSGSESGSGSGSASGSGNKDDNDDFTSCAQLSSLLVNAQRTVAPQVVVVASSTIPPIVSTPFNAAGTGTPSPIPYPTSTTIFRTTTGVYLTTPTTVTATPGRPQMPTSSAGPPLSTSVVPVTIRPTPTRVPSTITPFVPVANENIARIVLTDVTTPDWQSSVKAAIARTARDYCRANPSQCGLESPPPSSFDVTVQLSVDVGNDGDVTFDVSVLLATGDAIRGDVLLELLDEGKEEILTATGAAQISITAKPTQTPVTEGELNDEGSFPAAAVAGGVAGGLVLLVLIIVAVYLYKRHTGSFTVTRVQPLNVSEGRDVERPDPKTPVAVQEKQQEAWAMPPPSDKAVAVAALAGTSNPPPMVDVHPMRTSSPLEEVPLREFEAEVAERSEEKPGTVPQAHRGRASNPDIWPEARKATGRMASKTSLPPIGSQPI